MRIATPHVFQKDRVHAPRRGHDRITCHENMLVSGDKKVEQVRVAHAVHCGDDQLAELKLGVVSGGDSEEKVTRKTIRGNS